jgi:tetratricopeptide (TPR) repeat protein
MRGRSFLKQSVLPSMIRLLDKQIEASGLENPIVRQALGKVFIDRKQYEPAAHHLRLALEAQPNDRRTHELLVNIYDRMQDPEGAVRQLLQSVSLSRRDIALYKDLGGRYLRLEQPARAERAYTSIVEMLPNESEGHTMLAEIRQGQGDWQAAIHHWRQVVRIRALEPTGLLKLAEAQIHEKLWGAATQTVDVLRAKDWPSRFGNVHNQAEQLKNRVEQ